MFKRFFVLTMLFVFTAVQANASTHNNLKAAFDELTYSLTVEWDQQDKAFYNAQTAKFAAEVRELQAQGMSNQELIDFTVSQIKDENLARDLKNVFAAVTINNMTSEEAAKYVSEMMKNTYGQGANWSGGAAIGAVIGVIFFVAVAAIVFGYARPGQGCYEVYRCDQYCNGVYCYDDCGYKCI